MRARAPFEAPRAPASIVRVRPRFESRREAITSFQPSTGTSTRARIPTTTKPTTTRTIAPVSAADTSEQVVRICLCGLCGERARSRADELRSQALRLAQASVRARERGDMLRGAAYGRQAAAAVAEARDCEYTLSCSPPAPTFLSRVAAAFSAALRIIAPGLIMPELLTPLSSPEHSRQWPPRIASGIGSAAQTDASSRTKMT